MDLDVDLPECDVFYLLNYFLEIGPTIHGDPITHSEMRSWQKNTGIELAPWQSRIIRRLSLKYIEESREATARHRPSPLQNEAAAETEREKGSKQFSAAMASKFNTRRSG